MLAKAPAKINEGISRSAFKNSGNGRLAISGLEKVKRK
jgi:hypothetical protein